MTVRCALLFSSETFLTFLYFSKDLRNVRLFPLLLTVCLFLTPFRIVVQTVTTGGSSPRRRSTRSLEHGLRLYLL